MSGRIVYQGPLVAPIEEGVEVARLKLFRGNTLALDIPLVTAAAVPVGSLRQRAVDAGFELGVGLFRTYVLKK
jgi:D-alanyl-D-alanine carboxypeptidase (penicillin-binding protein 5/6)